MTGDPELVSLPQPLSGPSPARHRPLVGQLDGGKKRQPAEENYLGVGFRSSLCQLRSGQLLGR